MSCCGEFKKTLNYVSPSHGGWGVVRVAALVPESHQLFVAPFACGRHGALGGAVNGIKDRISYLYIEESDIVSGGYEDLIPEAVDELVEVVERKPKVIFIFVSCLDDLLGTDHVQLNKKLSKKHQGIEFRTCHMNPISLDTKFPPPVTLQHSMYSLLKVSNTKQNSVNMIGNHIPINKKCEIFNMLMENDIFLKHITDCESFEEFQNMGNSRLNIVVSPVAKYASEQMEKNLNIETILFFNSYDMDEIEKFYQQLANILNIEIDTSKYQKNAIQHMKIALKTIGDKPIAIDYQSVKKPFTLAKILLDFGFHVKLIMVKEIPKFEKQSYTYILDNYKEVEIVNALHHNMTKRYKTDEEFLCIGFDCAYATKSNHIVNIMQDEDLFGYYGIEQLMKLMVEANEKTSDLLEIIEKAGLVI